MLSDRDQLLIVFGLLYCSGALIELLIRTSKGIPTSLPPFFTQNAFCSVVLRPAVFLVLPVLLWPFVIAHRLLSPVVSCVGEFCCCCLGRDREEEDYGNERGFDDDEITIAGDSVEFAMMNRSGSTMDVLEKVAAAREDSPRPCDLRAITP